MRPTDVIKYVQSELGVDSGIRVFIKPETIYSFLKYVTEIVSERIPPVYDCSIPYTSGIYHIEIPSQYVVKSVYDVMPVRTEGSNTNEIIFDFYPSIFSMGVDIKNSFANIQNFIQDRANISTLLEMTGKTFGWMYSEQNRNKIYVDDIPPSTSCFYINFSAKIPALAEDYANISTTNEHFPSSQLPLIMQYVQAQTKITEGRILRRVSGGSQAATNDGEALVSEGTALLEAFNTTIVKQTYLT